MEVVGVVIGRARVRSRVVVDMSLRALAARGDGRWDGVQYDEVREFSAECRVLLTGVRCKASHRQYSGS